MLPEPHKNAIAHSAQLSQLIASEIKKQGPITFCRFMEMALYAPGLGYYSAGAQKFGEEGDFVTAPEISPLFSQCLANYCQKKLAQLNQGGILEFGAGTGIMTSTILAALEKQKALPAFYWILDVSADLKERQKKHLEETIPHLLNKVKWLTHLPNKPIEGIILANEVLDAMPVHLFKKTDKIEEYYVDWVSNQFTWVLKKASHRFLEEKIESLDLSPHYTSEINLSIAPWMKSLSTFLKKGYVLIIDYGFLRETYYHPQRSMGTLMCHYQHHAHDNPFFYPGLQDITAHVDFTEVGCSAEKVGFRVESFTNQANFLIEQGLISLLSETYSSAEQFKRNQQAKKLIMPTEMGELFKVISLMKGMTD